MSVDIQKIRNDGKRAWQLACMLIAMTGLAYIPAFGCQYIWDDDYYVTQNETLHDANGLRRIWVERGAVPQYYPLTHTTFWIEYYFWGLSPTGYHITNVLLHAIAAVLLWQLLTALQVRSAWLAAAIFAVHPVCVESVAWITERKNTLSTVFYLAAGLAFLKFAPPVGKSLPKHRWWFYLLTIVLFLSAMLSKTTTATFPCAALLVVWWKRGLIAWRDILPLIPMFVIAIQLGLITVDMEKSHVGADTINWGLSPIDRILVAGRALWFYAGKIALPTQLTFVYPRWEVDATRWWQYLFPAGFFVVIGVLWWKRNHLGRGPLVAVLFFAGTLAPALGFFDVYPMRFSFVADHFQYLASVGLITLVAATVVTATSAVSRSVIQYHSIGVGLLALAALTWFQCQIYKNQETLWNDTIAKNPQAWIAHNNLGGIRASQGDYLTAIGYFTEAIELNPELVEAHFNRGRAKAAIGLFVSAAEDMKIAIDLNPGKTHRVLRRACVLLAINGKDRLDEAQEDIQAIVEREPENIDATAILARIHLLLGNVATAERFHNQSEKRNPANAEMILTRGLLKVFSSRDQDGQVDLLLVMKKQPDRRFEVSRLIEAIGRLSF